MGKTVHYVYDPETGTPQPVESTAEPTRIEASARLTTHQSAQPCGCDPGINYLCMRHWLTRLATNPPLEDAIGPRHLAQRASLTSQTCGCTSEYLCCWHQRQYDATKKFAQMALEGEIASDTLIGAPFAVKDSGQRQQFESGMVRDTTDEKIDYELALDGPMFERLAIHLTKGAKKYARKNWMQANGLEELARFRASAVRHFIQWLRGDQDEDHAAAVFFNINGYEYTKERLK